LPPIDNQAYLFRVETTPDVKVFDTLAVTAISIDEFLRFNPGFKMGIEPPVHAYTLLLPWEQARNLAANVTGARIMAPSRYTVKRGDTLDLIARRHGIPSRQLAQWNGLGTGGVLKAGQQLVVYPAS
ncbi:MAG: LysM peptidoglycan-binding domain-containing protein, partial [Candidatus Competibacter sp.]